MIWVWLGFPCHVGSHAECWSCVQLGIYVPWLDCKRMSDYQSETGNTSADHYSIVKSDDFICKKGEQFSKDL